MNNFKVKKSKNGVPMYLIPVKGAKTATVLFIFNTGSRYENKDNNGISHFLEHMFFKGTKKRPDTATISSSLDSLGSEFNAFTGKEYTGYHVKVTSSKIKKASNIIGDMLLNSVFDKDEIEREKGVIIEELNMYEDNPLMHIEDVFEKCLYKDSPAGWDTIGTKKNIKGFKREDFTNYFKSQYGTKSLSFVIAGNYSNDDIKAVEKIINQFEDNKFKNKEKVVENQKKPEILAEYKKVDQVTLSLGVRTVPAGHKWQAKLKLLSIILGGSMSSRLFIKLRERSGLAYFVRTTTEFNSDSGYLTTQAGVPIEKAKDAVKIILDEYNNISQELITDKELKRVKDMYKGKLNLNMETSDEVANWYGRQAILHKNDITSPKKFLESINKITAKDLKKVAKSVFKDENLNLALIGDVKEDQFKKVLKLNK
ncbi:MAG: pitrilysin family protein [Patescibacteria group bacterium]|jgi:predicted Zn-dependent peptidase|nr:pitrilysin family protein [Patescibacteria group bacterium]